MAESPPRLIVIVEDDDVAASLFSQVLTAAGYRVSVSHGDDERFAAALPQCPAALLVDLHLGERDGLALLRRLRAVPALRRVPAAIITGDYFTDARVSDELESLGIAMHLKPLWAEGLLRVVEGLVEQPDALKAGRSRVPRLRVERASEDVNRPFRP